MAYNDIDCQRYIPSAPVDVDGSGRPLSILALASRASAAADYYRSTIDARADYPTSFRAGRALARAVDALTNAIADSVATGDNRLS